MKVNLTFIKVNLIKVLLVEPLFKNSKGSLKWINTLILNSTEGSSSFLTYPSYREDSMPETPLDSGASHLCSSPATSSSIPAGECHWCAGQNTEAAARRVCRRRREGNARFSPARSHCPAPTHAVWSCPVERYVDGQTQNCRPVGHKQDKLKMAIILQIKVWQNAIFIPPSMAEK